MEQTCHGEINGKIAIKTDAYVCSREHRITFYDVDFNKRLRLSDMMRLFSLMAGEDYYTRGLGHVFLKEKGFAFLVSKIVYKIYRLPTLEEEVILKTWVEEIKGAKFVRGYEMVSREGEQLVIGQAVWICVNPDTKKIVRPRDFPWCGDAMPREDMPVHYREIKVPEVHPISDYVVPYHAIDYNGHLNNTDYGDVIMNALPANELGKDIDEFTLCYQHEAYMGETVNLFRGDPDGKTTVIIGRVGERKCFESEIIYK